MEIQSGGSLWGRVIDKVKACNGVLHLSFDVDFLDPDVAPGVGTTVPGGGTYREAHLIMELLNDSGLVHSLDIVELNLCATQSRHRQPSRAPSRWHS
jgi:arginase